MSLEKTENHIPKNIQSSAPPLTARVLTTDEMLLSVLLLAWALRLEREIEVLGEKQVMKSNLIGLIGLKEEIHNAAVAFRFPQIVQQSMDDKQD